MRRKTALITGSQGFVGRYLRQELEEYGYIVTGLDTQTGESVLVADLLNYTMVAEVIAQVQPDVVFHLAGQSNVSKSWIIPQKTLELNVVSSVNLLEALHHYCPTCRIVLVGSSDQYGNLGNVGKLISETFTTHPQTPYAVSKDAQEKMGNVYRKAYGMNIFMTRSFNHAGAGQGRGFLIPDFASGVVAVERGEQPCIWVGNLDASRDFTHVRDIARAYRLIAEKGQPGQVYNVGSGRAYSAKEILYMLCSRAHCSIPVKQSPDKMRPSDTPVICCDRSKLTAHTGWKPELSMDQILDEVLQWWRMQY